MLSKVMPDAQYILGFNYKGKGVDKKDINKGS